MAQRLYVNSNWLQAWLTSEFISAQVNMLLSVAFKLVEYN